MRRFTLAVLLAGVAATCVPAASAAPPEYEVTLVRTDPPKVTVRARLRAERPVLEMATSRPADIPEVAERGWPGLVTNLKVVDGSGRSLEAISAGPEGWNLPEPVAGRVVTLSYEIDYAPLAARGWPAPREAAVADDGHVVLIGRSIFITSPGDGPATVKLTAPAGWQSVTPWTAKPTAPDLTENLVAFTREEPETVSAGGFRMLVIPMGHWQPARSEVRRVLGAVIPRLVALTRTKVRRSYLVVLLPMKDDGAESFRSSFALTVSSPPSRENSNDWGTMIAHEAYHQWNGWTLRGKDYASTQWFHEGFTEYAAEIAMTSSGMGDTEYFLRRLAKHVENSRKLTTALDAPGTSKGPPLYGAGALVAFTWDTQIREATAGTRSLWDFMQALWKRMDDGARPYEWADIQAALDETAKLDWAEFHRKHIQGGVPLPLKRTFATAGVRFDPRPDHAGEVHLDLLAPDTAKTLLQRLMSGS